MHHMDGFFGHGPIEVVVLIGIGNRAIVRAAGLTLWNSSITLGTCGSPPLIILWGFRPTLWRGFWMCLLVIHVFAMVTLSTLELLTAVILM
jgi:hypothetical protein